MTWNKFSELLYVNDELGFSLDLSRMHQIESLIVKFEPRFQEILQTMQDLEAGAIANPDENRQVGHYWLRAPELAPSPQISQAISDEQAKIDNLAAAIHRGEIRPERSAQFKKLLMIGIGGSALGPQLLVDALWSQSTRMEPYFCDNTDPDGVIRVVEQIGDALDETLVIITSKSGGTVEPINCEKLLRPYFDDKNLSFAKHAICVTCPGSKLDKAAKDEGWIAQIYMWDWVGGRTSLHSAVGLLPAALLGIDTKQFLAGAKAMDQVTRNPSLRQNPAALLAVAWYSAGCGQGRKDMVILPYKDRLVLFSRYLQQLIMESLGKELNLKGEVVNQGIAVYGNKGSTDQHAFVQQLREGVNNFFVTFIEVLADLYQGQPIATPVYVKNNITAGDYLTGFFLGTRDALSEKSRESLTITVSLLSAETLGMLIALYERAVGFYASMIGINAYHQPGVEAGKKGAEKVIALQQQLYDAKAKLGSSPLSVEEVADKIGAREECEILYKILEHLASNPGRGVRRQGSRHPSNARYLFL